MHVYLVTETHTDLAWLRWLLAPEVKEYKLGCYAGGVQAGAISTARSIVGVRLEPVIVVTNSGTTDPEKVAEDERITRELLGSVAPESLWRLCVAVPAVEAWILSDATLMKQLFGGPLPNGEKSRLVQDPKAAMEQLFKQAGAKYTPAAIQRLTRKQDASLLRERELVRSIRQYVEELAAITSLPLR
jgi:hypothetical protein